MPLLYLPRLRYTTELEVSAPRGYPVRNYRHIYDAESDSYLDTVKDIEADPLCMKRGDLDAVDTTCYVDRVKVVRNTTDDAKPLWAIHVETRSDFQEATDPRTDPADIEWYSQSYQALSQNNRHGKTVFNSAGSIFKFAHDDAYWIARVTKNVTQTPYELFDYENAINDSEIQIDGVPVAQETIRANGIRISPWRQAVVTGNRVYYKTVTFLLIHKREGWLIKKDNVGFEELKIRTRPKMIEVVREQTTGPRAGRRQIVLEPEVDTNGQPVYEERAEREPIVLPNGQRPFTEQVLDRSGQWVPDPRPEDVFQLEIDYYKPMPFGNLPGINDSPRPRGTFGF